MEAEAREADTAKAFREYQKCSRDAILELERKLQSMGYKDLTPTQKARLIEDLPLFEYAFGATETHTDETQGDAPQPKETTKKTITYTCTGSA